MCVRVRLSDAIGGELYCGEVAGSLMDGRLFPGMWLCAGVIRVP